MEPRWLEAAAWHDNASSRSFPGESLANSPSQARRCLDHQNSAWSSDLPSAFSANPATSNLYHHSLPNASSSSIGRLQPQNHHLLPAQHQSLSHSGPVQLCWRRLLVVVLAFLVLRSFLPSTFRPLVVLAFSFVVPVASALIASSHLHLVCLFAGCHPLFSAFG